MDFLFYLTPLMLVFWKSPEEFVYIFQAEKQLEVQLFKLFYNERDIDGLQEDLAGRMQALDKEKKKKEKIEDNIRDKKKEHGAKSRELTKIDQQIKETVSTRSSSR